MRNRLSNALSTGLLALTLSTSFAAPAMAAGGGDDHGGHHYFTEDDDGDGTRTRLDLIEDDFADPEDNVDAVHFKTLLKDKLLTFGADLEGREQEIFRDRLMSDEPATLQEFGDRWGVSRERARQIEKRLVLRLRAYLQQELGDAVQIALGHEV